MTDFTTSTIRSIRAAITVDGDKSISHRSIMIASLATGRSRVRGLLMGEDVRCTMGAMSAMGVPIETGGGETVISGIGLHGLSEPGDLLNLGNSGTSARILAGLLSGQNFFSAITGDDSLRSRPMKRVVEPLLSMGARITGREGGTKLPLAISGGGLKPIDYSSKIASAQVKSSILMAGLFADGATSVAEPELSRDHTERMLNAFGAKVTTEKILHDGVRHTIAPVSALTARDIDVPADISSAAFFIALALITPGSELTIENVGINETRTGILDILGLMGASIHLANRRTVGFEPVADIVVRSSRLKGFHISPSLVTRAIDEFPIIFALAALAEGTTTVTGAKELRVKESDRIGAMAEGLRRLGVTVSEHEDGIEITGRESLDGDVTIESHTDHRVAMSFIVIGSQAKKPVNVRDVDNINTSFPSFFKLLGTVGK